MSTKVNLPNNPTTSDNLTGELKDYNALSITWPRTTSGNLIYPLAGSYPSGVTYNTATYAGGIYANMGQQGMFLVLQDAIKNSLVLAADFNGKSEPSTNETITGVKTFSTAPVMSTITNTGTLTLPTATDTLVGRATSDTFTNKTHTSPKMTSGTSIVDINGNPLISFPSAISNAVNNLTISNSGAGTYPSISASGTDSGIGMTFNAKAASAFYFKGTGCANYIAMYPSITGNPVYIYGSGTDTNVDLQLSGQGSGAVKTSTQPTTATCLRNITISTSAPSGGVDGDIWFKTSATVGVYARVSGSWILCAS